MSAENLTRSEIAEAVEAAVKNASKVKDRTDIELVRRHLQALGAQLDELAAAKGGNTAA